MDRVGLLIVLASSCFTGLIECQNLETTPKATASGSTTPNGMTTAARTTAVPDTTMASIQTKSPGAEANIAVNPAAVDDPGTIQGAVQPDIANPQPYDDLLNEATVGDKESSFIIPTNEIKLSGNSGSILSVDDGTKDKDGQANTLMEESKMFGTGEIAVVEPTTKGQPKASSAIPSSDQTMTKSSTENVSGASPTATTTKVSEQPNKTTQRTSTSTLSAVTDSTQGTVAPAVTNVGESNPTSGTIVFKPGKQNDNSLSNGPITTTIQMNKGTTSAGKDNTTPAAGTTLNVIVPSTTSTTEMTQAGNGQTVTPSPNDPKIGNDVVLTNHQSSSNDVAQKSGSQIVISEQAAEPSAKSPNTVNDKVMKNTVVEQSGDISAIANDNAAEQNASDAVTSQSVLETTGSPGSEAQTDSPVVACSGLLCINECPHGRQVDERGCETCKCNFSPDCPTPLPTTRLLCMMQVRLGQSCSSDLDCPVQRICCPGSCGQSCRRKSSSRSRVLAILRKF